MRTNCARCTSVFALGLLFVGCGRIEPVEEIPADPAAVNENAAPITAAPDDWPWWRGPTRDGKAAAQQVPTTWSKTENVVWRAAVPGQGHSSPSVQGDRVYVTTADQQQQLLLCYDRATGKQRWSRVVHSGGLMRKHGKNSYASATPACDGRHIYTAFINSGSLRVSALDPQGTVVWQTEAGNFGSEHGYGSSPVLYRSLVIVLGDNLTGSFVAALDCAGGELVWRTRRETTGSHGSYATPIIGHVAGKDQLLVTGTHTTTSYDPNSGNEIWTCRGPAEVTANTIAFSDTLVFASGGYPESEILAIRGDGSGDVSDSHVQWRSERGMAYVPSPLHHDGRLYTVKDNGVTTCFDAQTGKRLWQQRLDGAFSASPVLVGEHCYVTNEAGTTFVFQADRKFEMVAVNEMGSGGFASPVICGGQIFLRTADAIYCIGRPVEQSASLE